MWKGQDKKIISCSGKFNYTEQIKFFLQLSYTYFKIKEAQGRMINESFMN